MNKDKKIGKQPVFQVDWTLDIRHRAAAHSYAVAQCTRMPDQQDKWG